jgi:hypothetical protein
MQQDWPGASATGASIGSALLGDRETRMYTRRVCSKGDNRSGFGQRRSSVRLIVAESWAGHKPRVTKSSYPPELAKEQGAFDHSAPHDFRCRKMPEDSSNSVPGKARAQAGSFSAAGRVKKNRLPLPKVLSAQMRPPCCSTMLRHNASPSPVPPSARESDASPC